MSRAPQELAAQLQGLLSFPVTPFNAENEIDLPRFREHIQYMAGQRPDGLFVCGGTGEFYSLGLDEYGALVRAAVEEAGGRLPIVAGVGYGTRLAIDFARAAEAAGADGLMVMPPYLLLAEQEGLYQHYQAIAAATRLGIILYQRDNAIFTPATVARLAEIPNVVGFKDGYGDMERLLRIRLAVGDRLVFLNGMPTAELSVPAFLGLGVRSYSSAVFNFVPEIAWAFYRAVVEGDIATRDRLLEGFYRPFAELRDRVRGYAVALVKAGVGISGQPVGPVRAPLLNPAPEHLAELRAIVDRGLAV
ncbi:MAG: 5-dehydro-4-deoxyglucarate dehydratase [Roseiflexaceae bacterium]